MTYEDAEQVRYYACERKQAFPDPPEAHKSNPSRRGAVPYRCPFCSRFHVGRAPSMQTLRRVARAIRVLHQEAPV